MLRHVTSRSNHPSDCCPISRRQSPATHRCRGSFDNFLGQKPSPSVHVGRLWQDIGHVVALLDAQRGMIKMIGRYKVAAVVILAIALGAGLLAFAGYLAIEVKTTIALAGADVVLSVLSEFHRAAFLAIEPDRKTFVI